MSKELDPQSATGIIIRVPGVGVLDIWGTSVPADATAGYATGCLYRKVNGGDGTALYLNEGTSASCDFNAINP